MDELRLMAGCVLLSLLPGIPVVAACMLSARLSQAQERKQEIKVAEAVIRLARKQAR